MRKVGSDTRNGVGYSGLDSLAIANERMQQSLAFEQRSAAQRNQIAQNTTQALQTSSQGQAASLINKIAAEENADQKRIAAKAQPGDNTLGQIAAAIGGAAQTYMNVKSKDRELDVAENNLRQDIIAKEQAQLAAQAEAAAKAEAERLKAEREANFVSANDKLKSYIQSNINSGKLSMETGLNEFRTMGLRIIDSVELDPDKRVLLANELYENIKTVSGRQLDDQEEYTTKLRAAATDAVAIKITTQLSGVLAQAGSDNPQVREAALPLATQMLTDMMSREDLDTLEKSTVVNGVMQRLLDKYTEGTVEHQKAREMWNYYNKFQYELAKATEEYNAGTLSISQWRARLEKKAIENRLPISIVGSYDPNAESKDAIESLERTNKVREMNEQAIVDAGELFDYTVEETGVLAIEMIANPGVINEMKTRAAYRNNPDVMTAIQMAEKYNEYRNKNAADRERRQDVITQIANIQQGGVKYLISQRKAAMTPDLAEIMKAAISGTPLETAPNAGMTADEIAANEAALQQVISSLQEKAALIDQQMNDRVEELKPYGLDNFDFEVLKKTNKEKQEALNTRVQNWVTTQTAKPKEAGIGIASPTNAGGKAPAFGGVKALAVRKTRLGTVVLPFRQGVQYGIEQIPGQLYGADRPRGKGAHAGEDMALAVGTELVAYVGMKLTSVVPTAKSNGGGYALTFLGDDGKYHKFLHLQENSSYYKIGQRVEAGKPFAKSGDTGNNQAHLHWEIRTNPGSGRDGALNPFEYMASMQSKASTLRPPVGNTKPMGSYIPGAIQPRMPKGARPLGGGEYLYQGKIHNFADGSVVTDKPETKINPAKPARAGRTTNNVKMYDNKKVQNYGYGAVAKDSQFLSEVHKMADRLGTSAQWLIDVMAFETGGTFNTGVINAEGSGAVGLIQFMPETAAKLGTTIPALRKMSRIQQLKYVEKYMSQYKEDLGKGVEYVLAAIWGGENLIKRLKEAPYEAYMWSDGVKGKDGKRRGGIRFHQYLDKLGGRVGRRYDGAWTRKDKLIASNTHTGYHDNCRVCQALLEGDNPIVAHEAQIA